MNIRYWRDTDIRLFAVAASLLLSAFSIIRNPVPNTDAFTYIRAADIFLQDGLGAAVAFYPWATYSLLIGLLHSFTGLELLLAAQILNTAFFALIAYAFISLVQEIDNSRRLSIIAAVFILLYPQLNEYRHDVIRDIGYLAFSLLALLQLMRMSKTLKIRHAIGFCITCLLASLFRPEALAYLLGTPLLLLVNTQFSFAVRARGLLAVYTFIILIALLVAGLLIGAGISPLTELFQAFSVYQPFLEQARSILEGGSIELSEVVFHEHAAIFSGQYMTIFLITGLFSILLIKVFTGFGWVSLLVLAYGAHKRLVNFSSLPRHVLAPAFAYLLIAISILLAFLFVTRFMTSRYTLLFCAVIVLLIPVIIERAWQSAQLTGKTRSFNRIIGFLILYSFIDAYISFGESKTYQTDVAIWVKNNTPQTMSLVTNNHYVAYKSGLIADYDKTVRLLDPQLITNASANSRLVFTLERGVDELMQDYIDAGVVRLERYFPNESEPQLGIYRKL